MTTPHKIITLRVRHEFEIPAVYRDGTMDEMEEALMIGAIIQQSVHTRRAHDGIQKMVEEKDQEIHRIQRGYHDRISGLEREIAMAAAESTKSVTFMPCFESSFAVFLPWKRGRVSVL